jgi:hypothetical protein
MTAPGGSSSTTTLDAPAGCGSVITGGIVIVVAAFGALATSGCWNVDDGRLKVLSNGLNVPCGRLNVVWGRSKVVSGRSKVPPSGRLKVPPWLEKVDWGRLKVPVTGIVGATGVWKVVCRRLKVPESGTRDALVRTTVAAGVVSLTRGEAAEAAATEVMSEARRKAVFITVFLMTALSLTGFDSLYVTLSHL